MRLIAILLMLTLPLAAAAQDRVAMVIGMAAYEGAAVPDGPREDAAALTAALEGQGFDVTTLIDAESGALKKELSDFAFQAETADIAVIYYAGRRIASGGESYLIPVGAPMAPASALRGEGVALPALLRAVGKARQIRLVVLDNCHAAPLQPTSSLPPPEPRQGTLVITSGEVGFCDDSGQSPSIFAATLADALAEPGVEIGTMLDRFRADLRSHSGGRLSVRRFGRLNPIPTFIGGGEQADGLNGPLPAWSSLSDDQAADLAGLAQRGDTRSQLGLAAILSDKDDPRYDPQTAAELLQRAVATGSPEARFQLAQLYEQGLGVAQDQGRALQLYQAAAERGHAAALNDLGFIHLQGALGQQANSELALDYFHRAADRRHPAAMFNFAAMIDDGKVSGRGAADAALYLYRALRAGDGTLLGLMQDEPKLFNSETRKALQRKLSDFGFYDGAIDGLYGEGTQAAIRAAFGKVAAKGQGEALETFEETQGADAPEAPPSTPATPESAPAQTPAASAEETPRIDAEPEPGADQNVTPVLRPKQAARG
ncbi:caspase family protein [Sulfitobacter dubius]|uniref:caspase family protein n=2 Tax=Roseobacteraceae TaxID=2854170 RepID=UPI0029423EA4|nr:caspase family protein [Sulfitobacter dubius]WOI29383.1 caspase family protein [Sulfitobacter dubius]